MADAQDIGLAFTTTRTGYVPAREAYFEAVRKLPPSSTLWAIHPDHVALAMDAFMFLDDLPEKPSSYYSVDSDGIATLSIMGPMARRMSGLAGMFFSGTDTDQLVSDLQAIAADKSVRGLMMHIDSPGGRVDGTREVMDAIREVKMPKVAYTDGMMASAAYWIGSAADRVMAGRMATIGSIGVVAAHTDFSAMDAKRGVKTTYIYNGKFKRIANDAEPLSEEARGYIQEQVDGIYDVFAGDVASNRGMTPDAVKAMESKVYLAEMAKQMGLVDQIATMQQAKNMLKRSAGIMTLDELKAEFPDVYKAAVDEGRQAVTAEEAKQRFPGIAHEAQAAGAQAERVRSAEIREAAFPGQDAIVAQLIASDISPDEARKRLIADQKGRMAQGLAQIMASDVDVGSHPEPKTGAVTATSKTEAGDKLDAITRNLMASRNMTYEQAFNAAKVENPELTKIYLSK